MTDSLTYEQHITVFIIAVIVSIIFMIWSMWDEDD